MPRRSRQQPPPVPVKEYSKFFQFERKFLPETPGMERPRVLALEWNPRPQKVRSEMKSMVLVAIKRQIRVIAEVQIPNAPGNYEWKFMMKRKYAQEQVVRVRWNPNNAKVFAVGVITDGGESFVEFFAWSGEKFKCQLRFEVSNSDKIFSISWDSFGTQLLATIPPTDNAASRGIIIVAELSEMHDDAVRLAEKKEIDTPYKTSFLAEFQPTSGRIFSTEIKSKGFIVWGKRDDGSWERLARLNADARHVKKMCFNANGDQLSAICEEGEKKIWVWNYSNDPKPSLHSIQIEVAVKGENTGRGRPTLNDHCRHLISLDFTIPHTVVTGSSKGSICIHEQKDQVNNSKMKYKAICFKWEQVQVFGYNDIVCVANEPSETHERQNIQRIFSGGCDGIVSLWKVTHNARGSSNDRDALFDMHYYAPDWEDYEELHAVPRLESIPTDKSSEDSHSVSSGAEGKVLDEQSPDGKTNVPQEAQLSDANENVTEEEPFDILVAIGQLQSTFVEQTEMMGGVGTQIKKAKEDSKKVQVAASGVQDNVDIIEGTFENMQTKMKNQGDLLNKIFQHMSSSKT